MRTRRRVEPVQEPIYVNEMAEAVRILQRIEDKLDAVHRENEMRYEMIIFFMMVLIFGVFLSIAI